VAADLRGGGKPPSANPANQLRWGATPTPIGEIVVVISGSGVLETAFCDDGADVGEVAARIEERRATPMRRAPKELAAVLAEVRRYFAGSCPVFATPVDLSWMAGGFARRVLETTTTIPYGELWTYGDVAEIAGSPRGGRAAGNALAHCPIELFVPCHRVVHVGGAIRGYGRHEDRKRWLIHHESRPAFG
jgi:methylated-DNA-[protein]-cysteine S-methyltransferase